MAVLTEATLEAGRMRVRANDMKGLMDWLDVNEIVIDRTVLRDILIKLLNSGNIDRAVKIFDAAFVGCDPKRQKLAKRFGWILVVFFVLFQIAIGLLVLAAGIGGALYLYRAVNG